MIRHSALPKLQKCPCFESAGGTSPAASRGTKIDSVVRRTLQGEDCMAELSADDQEAAKRGVEMVKSLVPEGTELETRESELWVKTPGMDHVGTEDIRAQKIRVSFDVKSGQVYDYEAQMSAYALGNMTRFFEPEWTCYLLFVDQNRVVEHKFTMDSATELVESIIKAYNDPDKKPVSNSYCNWCAKKNTCPQVVKPTEQTLRVVNNEVSIDTLKTQLAEPEKLGKFLKACNIFKKELWDWAKDEAKAKLERGEEVPGWRLSKVKGAEEYTPEVVAEAAQATGATFKELAELYGNIGAEDFRKWANARDYFPSAEDSVRKKETTKMIEAKK
jgi:hypothetical protein